MDKWQPIETAPETDCFKPVLLTCVVDNHTALHVDVGYRDEYSGRWVSATNHNDYDNVEITPVAWMPYPSPFSASEDEITAAIARDEAIEADRRRSQKPVDSFQAGLFLKKIIEACDGLPYIDSTGTTAPRVRTGEKTATLKIRQPLPPVRR